MVLLIYVSAYMQGRIRKKSTHHRSIGGICNESIYGPGFSVSVDCQHPELAVRFIDYFYSENGIRLTNYGKQGSTYRVEHGDPVYTDAVITQPDLLNEYTSMCFCGVVSEARLELELDNATLDASRKWLTNKDSEYKLPSTLYTDPSVEEDLRANIFDVSTYAQTVTIELIVGERPLSDIPEIQHHLRKGTNAFQ